MTPKMKAFVEAKALGVPNREAAISAGYTPLAAGETAGRLMGRPDIKKAIKAAIKVQTPSTKGGKKEEKSLLEAIGFREKYDNSLDFMQDCMNNAALPPALRFEAAKQLLPYQNARLGEKGKKETKKDAAHEVGRGKFAAKQPPRLHAVK